MNMTKLWAGLAAAAAVVSAVTLAAMPAQAADSAAYTVTISANSAIPPITGDVLVVYKYGKYSAATIQGTVTPALEGDVATLYAQEFPYKKAPVAVGTQTLSPTSGSASYSFSAKPSLATRYDVVVTTGTTVDGTSPTQTVYVTPGGKWLPYKQCKTHPSCSLTLRAEVWMPSSAYKTEAAKHQYFYLGLKRSRAGEPAPLKTLYLDKNVSISIRKVNAGEFEVTYRFTIDIGNFGYRWSASQCTRDDLGRDGIGLPGHHDCGNKSVLADAVYLG
jgi:hypothetical protein